MSHSGELGLSSWVDPVDARYLCCHLNMRCPPAPGLCFEPDDSIILEGSGIFQKWGVVGGSGHWQSGFLRGIPVAKPLPVQEMGHLLPNTWYHGQNP